MKTSWSDASALAVATCCMAQELEPALLSDLDMGWVKGLCILYLRNSMRLEHYAYMPTSDLLSRISVEIDEYVPKPDRIRCIANALVRINDFLSVPHWVLQYPCGFPTGVISGMCMVEISLEGPDVRAYFRCRRPIRARKRLGSAAAYIRYVAERLASNACGPYPDQELHLGRFGIFHPMFYGGFGRRVWLIGMEAIQDGKLQSVMCVLASKYPPPNYAYAGRITIRCRRLLQTDTDCERRTGNKVRPL